MPMFEILSVCKGGGYQYARTSPQHPRRNSKGLYPLHRVIMENHLGRLLEHWEQVHHKNEDRFDNRPENLEVLSRAEHARHHAEERACPVLLTCPICSKPFELLPGVKRTRENRNLTGQLLCSRACGAIAGNRIKG